MASIPAAALAALLLLAPVASAADDDREPAPSEQADQSPILSLLLLPVTVLIRMASVLGPDESGKTAAGGDTRDDGASR
ncbi:MAG: hypothetical protein HYY35_08805 [Deltaproteobacteria bacterium]|nr:hypothetical protein [Deltaproteobacteria bacterium]